MISVLILFLAANKKKKECDEKHQNEIATRKRQYNITVSDAIARKIDTQNKKTVTGHQRDRDEKAKTVTTSRNTRTGHWRDRDKRATTLTTARNGSAC